MDSLQQGVLMLLRSGLTGEVLSLPQEFDMAQAYPLICRHQISALAYEGALRCGISKTLPEMKRLFQHCCQGLLHNERQLQAIARVCAAFDAAGIDYMPLKGCHLKRLNPRAELRPMGDADILIRMEQYNEICRVMETLAFEKQVESDHELIWHSPELHLELHKRLVPSYDKDYYRFFGDGWQMAELQQGTRYGMKREDEYIYLFVHFAKHYRGSGIGLRHAADLWVYRRAYPELDEGYILERLEQMRLAEFYRNICRVIAAWFEDGPQDDVTSFITDVIFANGAWGNRENSMVSMALRNKQATGSMLLGKGKRIVDGFFPPYSVMWQKYPLLKKLPILLPIFWVVRWVSALLFRRDSLRRQYEELRTADTDAVSDYQQALNYVGLDFHFKE